MNIANIYRNLKQILEASNEALASKGLPAVSSLSEIPSKINSLGEIDKLQYLISKEIVEITAEDFEGNIIRNHAFSECHNLREITIPNNITNIGAYAFSGCESLKNIIIPEGVSLIEFYTFQNCTELEDITLPSSITELGNRVFDGCLSLKNIYMHAVKPPFLNSNNSFSSDTVIHVPVGYGDVYKSATNWSKYASIIIDDIILE